MANKNGDKTPPCRTPHRTWTPTPIVIFHITAHHESLYQLYRMDIKWYGNFFSISLTISPWVSTLSNALLASRKAQWTLLPLFVKYLTDSTKVNRAWLQLLFLLKPNCSGSLIRNSLYSPSRTDSNNLEILVLKWCLGTYLGCSDHRFYTSIGGLIIPNRKSVGTYEWRNMALNSKHKCTSSWGPAILRCSL